MMKAWNTPVYAFYHPIPTIGYEKKCHYHEFSCFKKSCSKTICRFLDTGDSSSTGNMHRHSKKCWGEDIVTLAMNTSNADEAREVFTNSKDGSIAEAFKVKGKAKVTYSHQQHTKTETRYCFPINLCMQCTNSK